MKLRGIKGCCRENNIDLLLLFGSRAAGKTHPASDIDVAVKLKKDAQISKLELIYRLADFVEGGAIDLVVLTSDSDPLLLHEIFFNGLLLYESKKGLLEKEKLRAWKLYLDSVKIRRASEQYLKDFARKVSNVA